MKDFSTEIAAMKKVVSDSRAASSIGLMSLGGSYAYGLATPNSDVDLRGFYIPSAEALLLGNDHEQIETHETVDGILYSARKMTNLLLSGNPNTTEVLGILPEHVFIDSPWYQMMRDNADAYLSMRAANTFGGYAAQQLKRIENAMSRDSDDKETRAAELAVQALRRSIDSFSERFPAYRDGKVSVYVELSNTSDMRSETTLGADGSCSGYSSASGSDGGNTGSDFVSDIAGFTADCPRSSRSPQVLIDMSAKGVPASELRGICGDLDAIAKNADIIAARNRKKETGKLSKHMSHLVRLLRMGRELLETGKVNTFRADDADFLIALKQGLWMTEEGDGTRSIDDAFWDMFTEEQRAFDYARRNSVLPREPDTRRANDILMTINASALASSE